MASPFCTTTAIQSSNFKFVFLHDWWLVKANGGLAVGGFASRETCGVRGFCSAAIAKRHVANTLETLDGFTIMMSGFINRSQTQENGFSSEVCNHFLFGFPYYWETYATQCFSEKSTNIVVSLETSIFDESENRENFKIGALHDLPVTRVRDLFFSVRDSEKPSLTESIFNDILGEFSDKAAKNGVVDSICEETPVEYQKAKLAKNSEVEGNRSVGKAKKKENWKFNQSKISVDVTTNTKAVLTRNKPKNMDLTPKRGVSTRSMTRSLNYVAK